MSNDEHTHRTIMNISLPTPLAAFVDSQVSARGYVSSSAYICDLIRAAQRFSTDKDLLEERLLEAVESGAAEPFKPDFFDQLRARVEAADSDCG